MRRRRGWINPRRPLSSMQPHALGPASGEDLHQPTADARSSKAEKATPTAMTSRSGGSIIGFASTRMSEGSNSRGSLKLFPVISSRSPCLRPIESCGRLARLRSIGRSRPDGAMTACMSVMRKLGEIYLYLCIDIKMMNSLI